MSGDSEKLVIRRRIAATPEELFAEWTDPQGMGAWMCPGDIVSSDVVMDLRVGGSLRINMRTASSTYEHRGEFTIIDPPTRLAFTWIAKATDRQPTLVTVELFKIDQKETELVLTHEKFPTKEVRDRYQDGWSQIINRLERQLRTKP